jgi:hypothetical protein
MPKNRIIPFGYCMKNGEIITEPKEVYAVVTIFNEYLKGKSLLEIAALMEVPYSENSSWNKNMVKRIIENDRYLGTEKYPQIIDKETFKLANEKRVRKATVSIGQTEEVKLLKQITFCKECGQKLTRTKENLWDCRRPECYRFDHLLTDQMILSAVLNVFNTVIANPTLINSDCTVSTYSPNAKVRFQQNEINRMTDMVHTDEKKIKLLFFESHWCYRNRLDEKKIKEELCRLAQLRYDCCTYDDSQQKTELLKSRLCCEQLNTLDIGLFKACVSRIWISHFCTIEVEFINGVHIKNITERNDKNVHSAECNGDTCESADSGKP